MFKTALNKNIIPHTWKLANIVPIPKPNKDTDKGTSIRPISLLSVIAKTLKSLLPYITANIPMQHGYKTQYYTVTALHTLNNTVAKGFNQMAPPARTLTVALDMSKAFDTINIHTLIRKLIQTNIPCTMIKLIANYIKGHKAYTTYRNHTSRQRQFKIGVPQGVVLSPTLFNIYTPDLPPPSAPVQVMAYADDITITSTSMSAAKKYIQPYLHKVIAWTKQNNLIRGNNKILRTPPPHISSAEEILPYITCRTLAQLRTNKSPFLKSYLHKVDVKSHPSPTISSTAPTYTPHCHTCICGQTPLE